MTQKRNEYPRPQFQRENWINLNGDWNFTFDDRNEGINNSWFKNGLPHESKIIQVPFAYQSVESGINQHEFHDIVWYERAFSIPDDWKDQKVHLHFGAVDYRCWVYMNGSLVGFHEGGHTSFHFDVTPYLDQENSNHLVLRVEDPSNDETIPRGKQYWKEQSESIFYTRTTGIWQTVWLEPVDTVHFTSIRWTPDIDHGSIGVEMEISDVVENLKVDVHISFKGKTIINDTISILGSYTKRSFDLRNRFTERSNIHGAGWYWSPENPNLFDVELRLQDEKAERDAIKSYFGMRKVSIDNGKLLLNNQPYYQKLVLDQGYFPSGLLTAPSDDSLKNDILLAKQMGFNGARKHQKIEDPRYFYHADTLGFLVWGEMANAAEYSEEAAARLTREWIEAVKRDYSHPSLIVWVPLNESWGISRVARDKQQQSHSLAMYYLTKSLDTTRPVLSNDGWEHTISDICGIHNYQSANEMKKAYESSERAMSTLPANRSIYASGFEYNGEPILITEYGGIAYKVCGDGWGYSSVQSGEELIQEYKDITEALFDSPVVQGFCYTQLTDVEQEINGLLTYDRKPKCELSKIKEINDRR
ncbi:glycoside hydrolase family 2 protein [Fictibacillus terranigra]|uniref:Glycoside hydrolase family 2 TIM barrel-domain containing protein n=1 Tax=Fictibacillus terranigra TaxID=3058424 RepID=A0ABT8EBY7_9BACL|nr:sugar-binding domain-containing protein [Fictibacillus sp. CENA-BCM004]MDN4075387.1 glycoside hydrolase family 2 TIM barrel-domain containing protein [Fictibacillus sp. CENA-BCM004]